MDERELAIRPVVQESIQHNARVSIHQLGGFGRCLRSSSRNMHASAPNTLPLLKLFRTSCAKLILIPSQTVSNIRALTASLFGVAAGTLGLESYPGFIFYLIGTAVVSVLIYALKAESDPKAYFFRPLGDLWAGDLFGGLMSFVLTWTLFYGLCYCGERAYIPPIATRGRYGVVRCVHAAQHTCVRTMGRDATRLRSQNGDTRSLATHRSRWTTDVRRLLTCTGESLLSNSGQPEISSMEQSGDRLIEHGFN
nr:er membrane protein complex subunit 6 [Quercus suber]